MVFLLIFTLLPLMGIFSFIWWCIFVYTNKWIATFITLAILGIGIALFLAWAVKPTQQEINTHIRKALSV